MAENILEQLKRAAATRAYVALERDGLAKGRTGGFVLAVSEQLVLIQQQHDFYLDGWAVLRLDRISEVDHGPRQQFYAGLLAAENVRCDLPTFDIRLWTMASVLEAVRAEGRLVIVECETPDEDTSLFYLCEVLAVAGNTLRCRPIDTLGQWEEEDEVPIDSITTLQIDTPYGLAFERHRRRAGI